MVVMCGLSLTIPSASELATPDLKREDAYRKAQASRHGGHPRVAALEGISAALRAIGAPGQRLAPFCLLAKHGQLTTCVVGTR